MTLEVFSEKELYPHVERFLHLSFKSRLEEQSPASSLTPFVADTSQAGGAQSGHWSRPDLAALLLSRGTYVPYWRCDLHTFEVKTASGVSEASVHEANAHGRFGQYAWLVFQSFGANAAPDFPNFKRVTKLALQFGVGVIHFDRPEDPNTWKIEHWPRRTGADLATADDFVRDRFPANLHHRIREYLVKSGWPT